MRNPLRASESRAGNARVKGMVLPSDVGRLAYCRCRWLNHAIGPLMQHFGGFASGRDFSLIAVNLRRISSDSAPICAQFPALGANMATKYPKYEGNCVVCGEFALLYGQPEGSAWRGWCEACNKRYEYVRENRANAEINHADFLRGLMAIRASEESTNKSWE